MILLLRIIRILFIAIVRFSDYIYHQFKGFLQAGKKLQPPQSQADFLLSRMIALVLIAVAGGMALFALTFSHSTARIMIRAVITVLACLAFAARFYKGISVKWMVKGLLKYRMPTILLIYLFFVTGFLLFGMFTGQLEDLALGLLGGGLMLMMGLVFLVGYYKQAQDYKRKAKETSPGSLKYKSGILACYVMMLMGLAIFLGGFTMVAWGTGLADWFFEDLLGW